MDFEVAVIGKRKVSTLLWLILVAIFYGYAGMEFDPESGVYYDRARMYNPAVGRFTTTDPLALAAGDYNLYRYVGNNPLKYTDPTGKLFLVDDLIEAGSSIIAVGLAVGTASAITNFIDTYSISSAFSAGISGTVSGATSAAGTVDLAFSFLAAPTSVPNSEAVPNGIQAITNPRAGTDLVPIHQNSPTCP